MNYLTEDLIDFLEFDFSRNNPKFEGILNTLMIHAGLAFTRLYKENIQDLLNDRYAASNVTGHWIGEITTALLDLSSNKHVQEIICSEPDQFRQLMKRYCITKESEKKFNEEGLKIIPDKLNSFYESFIEYCIQFIEDYIRSKLNISNLSKSDKRKIHHKTTLNLVAFYMEYFRTLTGIDYLFR